ncbi:hypothetical protein SELMODRAFT_187006 [Selaginella moellendorffii]|uniref:Nudix hydrolase domain-containing protein n=1 Tax=Selaginella moellendorffii TaxID=88036 RepID=D8TB32_SELML|nr:nudix hydrolase 3 [Selaginella moellendorffii]EFJ06089.1 hypothetical protein SELMODRAFT_187006 [Selaginella moellendorffii]|eukprot:XP_002992799.1 nudix hydrolase 3 [Selaginella moellendorffii]
MEEFLDVLTPEGAHAGFSKPRNLVHRDGDYHRAVQVCIYAESTKQILLQKRADCKDSWPGLWDISSAGHISAGDTSLHTVRKELEEELGIILPEDAFELLFVFLQRVALNDGKFINNEYNDVYLVTTIDPMPLEAFTLQESEVSDVKYMSIEEYKMALIKKDPAYLPYDMDKEYHFLFSSLEKRYASDAKHRISTLQSQLSRYCPVNLTGEIGGVSDGDIKALSYTIRAAQILDRIFIEQECSSNPDLSSWLEKNGENSELDHLKLSYFRINKSPWSCLDENEAFLTTADSAIKSTKATVRSVHGWNGLEYRAAFPVIKPPGANFYPLDMDKAEFEAWKSTLNEQEKEDAIAFFTVIRRNATDASRGLFLRKYSEEYKPYLVDAAKLLNTAGDCADTPSLQRLLKAKAESFVSNDYFDSDVAWIELESAIDVTIGPYETYEDALFGYKATFEAFIGVRDHVATEQVRLFSGQLQTLEDNLPLADKYKSTNVKASPIRVIQLIFNSGDVKGPQTVAFNLPNDERIVKERGSAMVMLKNVSQTKFDQILLPIAKVCIAESQKHYVDFEAFFAHTICHECCHGIGPHTIVLPDGRESTVRLELQECHSSLEEAKADVVGLWALHYLLDQGLLSRDLEKSMYVSFLAGCFRSIRFGLEEAHGKGQALQFNWIYNKGGFELNSDGTFSINFHKVRDAVKSLCTEIMTVQALGDKAAAISLLSKYATVTPALERMLSRVRDAKIPVDVVPSFDVLERL